MRNSVRTPPISTTELASRGKPRRSVPTSDEVPPTSTTIASASPDRKAAPRIELVAPEAKLMTGSAVAGLGRHHGAVVLGQIERGVDAARGNRGPEPVDRDARQIGSAQR